MIAAKMIHAKRLSLAAFCIVILLHSATAAAATSPKTLHDFGVGSNDGSSLYSALIMDSAGNLYGTSVNGGKAGAGTVYRLSPSGAKWAETILYSFTGGSDGSNPHSTLVLDSAGNLYGATVEGGETNSACRLGCGVVFELTPTTSGEWTETILHSFTGASDGGSPFAGVIFDAAGNLYGTSVSGGANGKGVAYELEKSSGWQEIVLHNFAGGTDGETPYAPLIFDQKGNLYGTTYSGGSHNSGTVYQLVPSATSSSASWAERILHSFAGGSDGVNPFAGVAIDPSGNLYGVTQAGGSARCGVAFRLAAAHHWSEMIMHTFLGLSAADGCDATGGVVWRSGVVYGTTTGGGKYNPGTIFKLNATAQGWKETILYNFTGGNDGAYPSAALTTDSAGNLYGTTLWGGPAGDTVGGVAFEFTP
ncbi:MAG TPA: choice-of-anchor tandem repeat GloVer-containing protein [Candidatus Sulfotelmatobacter sp.]|jgi:uncharacterized repeat protein (TIGR03803 family)